MGAPREEALAFLVRAHDEPRILPMPAPNRKGKLAGAAFVHKFGQPIELFGSHPKRLGGMRPDRRYHLVVQVGDDLFLFPLEGLRCFA